VLVVEVGHLPLSIMDCSRENDDRVLGQRVAQIHKVHILLYEWNEEIVLQQC
jgi:hypothetical protein